MKNPTRLTLLTLCVVLALGVYFWPETPLMKGLDRNTSTTESPDIDDRAEAGVEERAPVSPEPDPTATRDAVPPIPGKLVIIGRCLQHEDKMPLVGCEVFLEHPITDNLTLPGPHSPIQDTTAIHDEVLGGFGTHPKKTPKDSRWPRAIHRDRLFLTQAALDALRKSEDCYRRAPNAVSAEDGRFRVELDVPEAPKASGYSSSFVMRGWTLSLRSPMRTPWNRGIVKKRGEVLDLGDIDLPRGQRVTGRVVDALGKPVTGARISWAKANAESNPHPLRPPTGLVVAGFYHETSSGGYFALEFPVHDGAWQVSAKGDGFAIEPQIFHVAGQPVDVVLGAKRLPSIRGTLLDESGTPIVSGLVAVGRDGEIVSNAKVQADGTFEFMSDGPQQTLACIKPKGSDFHLSKPSPWLRWGESVNLVGARMPSLTLRLVNAKSGTPVQGKVWLYRSTSESGRSEDCFCEATSEPGVYTSDYVPGGQGWLTIRTDIYGSSDARPSGYFLTRKVLVDVPSKSPRELTIRLEAAVRVRISVVNEAGAPVNATVIDLLDAAAANKLEGIEYYQSWTGDEVRLAGNYAMDGGTVDLLAPADKELILLVKGPRLAIEMRRGIRLARGEHRKIHVVLTEGGTLQVKSRVGAGRRLELLHSTSRLRIPLFRHEKTGEYQVPGADARFPPPHLAPGDYDVFAVDMLESRTKIDQVKITKGKRTELGLDLRDHVSAHLKCKVIGLPARHGALRVAIVPVGQTSPGTEQSCSASNEIDARLPPGRYRLWISSDKSAGSRCHASPPFELAPGEQRTTPLGVKPFDVSLRITGREFPSDAIFEFHRQPGRDGRFHYGGVLVVDKKRRAVLPRLGTAKMRIVEANTGATSETFSWSPGQKEVTARFR